MSSSSLGSVTLDITIKKAEGLVAKDWSIMKSRKTSDPYVNICVGNRIVKRTTIQHKTCNPEWDESFQIAVDGDDPVSLEIYDHDDLTQNDLMGTVVIYGTNDNQTEIGESSLETKWFDVEKSDAAQDASGRIQVQLGVNPVDA